MFYFYLVIRLHITEIRGNKVFIVGGLVVNISP